MADGPCLVSDPDSEVPTTSGSDPLPALPLSPPPVLERERTNMREKEVRRMRGRPPTVVVADDDVTKEPFLGSSEGLLEPKKQKHWSYHTCTVPKIIDFARYDTICSGGKRDTTRNISFSISFSSTIRVISRKF